MALVCTIGFRLLIRTSLRGGSVQRVSQQILASPKIKLGYLTLTASCCIHLESRTLLSFGLFVDRARRAAGVLLTAPEVSLKKGENDCKGDSGKCATRIVAPDQWPAVGKRAGKSCLRPFPAVNDLAQPLLSVPAAF